MKETDDVYRRLQRHLDNMPVGFPATSSGVELRILKRLFTPDEAEIVLNLSMFPEPIEKVYKRMKNPKMSIEELEKILDNLATERGLIVGGDMIVIKGVKHYSKLQFVVGIYEGQLNKLTKELVEEMAQYEDEGLAEELMAKPRIQQVRFIPAHKSIENVEYTVGSYDSIEEIVNNTKGPIAVMDCICMQKQEKIGKPCKKSDFKERCFTLGFTAEYVIKKDIGRELTKAEALEHFKKMEEIGLVLTPSNAKNPMFICCCCGCCCLALQVGLKLASKGTFSARYVHTNFYAQVDAEKCTGCGICLNRCNLEAIKIVDNIATVNLDRCIGCGLCKTTCEAGAISLIKKEKDIVPPKDTERLYLKILRERFGPLGTMKILAKKALGKKV